jgi:hypothetical protein
LSATLQKRVSGILTSSQPQPRELNAETVTTIATSFLKRIGNKGNLKAKRVSLEENIYTVEVEMKKFAAILQIDSKTHEIKSYEIQPKGEETSAVSISPKSLLAMFGVSVAVYFGLYFALKMFGL